MAEDNPLFGKFDEVVNAVVGTPPSDRPSVITWDVPIQSIYDNSDRRLDASHYDLDTELALQNLRSCGYPLSPLAEMATITLPGQFVRIWAKDKAFGYPYVNATDIMSLMGMGVPGSDQRYLSRESDVDFEGLIIREGWLLVSCSGTIGRVFYVPKRLDGWAATHDIIRIIPNKGVPVGFIHAYLTSEVAQRQILGHTHGGQIDHITDVQIGTTLVPELPEATVREIHDKTLAALKMREKALSQLAEASESLKKVLGK